MKKIIQKIKSLFVVKSNNDYIILSDVSVQDILSDNQIDKAYIYYKKHKEHVDNIVKICKNKFEPSQIEDKNNPYIWKAEHWKWFLENKK